jgi:hypothetical protein
MSKSRKLLRSLESCDRRLHIGCCWSP